MTRNVHSTLLLFDIRKATFTKAAETWSINFAPFRKAENPLTTVHSIFLPFDTGKISYF